MKTMQLRATIRPKAEEEAHVASTVTNMVTFPEIADTHLSRQGNEPLKENTKPELMGDYRPRA